MLRDIRRDMNKVESQFPTIGDKEWAKAAKEFGVKEPPGIEGLQGMWRPT